MGRRSLAQAAINTGQLQIEIEEDPMRRIGPSWLAVAATAIIICGCSKTEGPRPPESEQPASAVGTGGAGANLSDDDFVRDVALKNIAAVELGRMALARATNPDVKSFAQRMIDDHGAAVNGLKSVVSGQPIEWPVQLDGKHRKIVDELAGEQDGDFDRDYVKAMVDAQQDLAAKLESRLDVQSLADWKTAAAGRTHSKALPDPNVAMRDVPVRPDSSDIELTRKINQWAAETYPIAQKHLDAARSLETAARK
jgi:putative membrane protein